MTKAAESLFVAQSSLSQSVKKIEDQLGCKLFNRVGNKLYLTNQGECFVKSGLKIIKTIRDMENEMADISRMKRGKIVLGITNFLGSHIVPAFFNIFKQYYPKAALNLVEGSSTELEEKIISYQIDIAVLPLPTGDPALMFQKLFASNMVVIMDKDNPLTKYGYCKKDSKHHYFDLKRIKNMPYILGLPGQRIRLINEIILEKANIKPNTVYTSSNTETVIRMVNTGLGITIVPEKYLNMSHNRNNIEYFYIENKYDFKWETGVVYHKDSYISEAIDSLLSLLHESIKNIDIITYST